MSTTVSQHRIQDLIGLEEFVASGESPWKIDRLRKVARLALAGDPKYRRLPFFQAVRGGRILVNAGLLRRRLYEQGASAGYRQLCA